MVFSKLGTHTHTHTHTRAHTKHNERPHDLPSSGNCRMARKCASPAHQQVGLRGNKQGSVRNFTFLLPHAPPLRDASTSEISRSTVQLPLYPFASFPPSPHRITSTTHPISARASCSEHGRWIASFIPSARYGQRGIGVQSTQPIDVGNVRSTRV
jgi:hypothetical protein